MTTPAMTTSVPAMTTTTNHHKVWRFTLENAISINDWPLATIASVLLQEAGMLVMRIDLNTDASVIAVFAISLRGGLPARGYPALADTRITHAQELFAPIPVPAGWLTVDMRQRADGSVQPIPVRSQNNYPSPSALAGAVEPFATALALARPRGSDTEYRSDLSDLGPDWEAPRVIPDGRAAYSWVEFMQYHGAVEGSRLWEIGMSWRSQPITELCVSVADVEAPDDDPPELTAVRQRIAAHFAAQMEPRDIPDGSGPTAAHVRRALCAANNLSRLASLLGGSLDTSTANIRIGIAV